MTQNKLEIPNKEELIRLRRRRRFRGEDQTEFLVVVETITPRVGGGERPRTVSETMRPASLRGMWRIWWRALEPAETTGETLARKEATLWGGMNAGEDEARRSRVEIQSVLLKQETPKSRGAKWIDDHLYALWPFKEGTPPLEPRDPGERFELRVCCPKANAEELQRTLSAWILFGGYGGRTRRGLGSLRPIVFERDGKTLDIMPGSIEPGALAQELSRLLGCRFGPPTASDDTPRLTGATLLIGESPTKDPVAAWSGALKVLQEFRQGPSIAREPGSSNHPGRSFWPEPDRMRRRGGPGPWAHEPRFSPNGGWPRAAFGLPIQTRFQNESRKNVRYPNPEPAVHKLELADSDRLASPVIVKPLPLRDGSFLSIVLWLNRAYPKANLKLKSSGRETLLGVRCDQILGPDDTAPAGDRGLFKRMQDAQRHPEGLRVRTLFCDWLTQEKKFRRIFG